MAPSGAIRLKRSALFSLILVNVLSACLVGHTNADTVGRPALQQQAGSMAAGTPALHGMNLPIHVDHVGEADKWSKADAYMMSQIIERTSKIVSATADATVAAAEAVIEPLMQYAHVQGMVGTLVTAAHAAADAKDSIPISTDGPWPIADDADEHMMPELTDMQDWVDESYEGAPLSAFFAPTSNPGLDIDAYYDDLLYDEVSKHDPNSAEADFVDLYSDIHVQHQPAATAPTTPSVTQQHHQQQPDVLAAWAARSASAKWGPSSIHKTFRDIHSSPTTSTESSTAKVLKQSALAADPTFGVEFKRQLMQGPRRSLTQITQDPGFIPGVIPGFIPGIGQPTGTPSPPATTTPTPPLTTRPPTPTTPTTPIAPDSPVPPEKPGKDDKDEKDEKPPSPTSPTPDKESPEPEPSPVVDDTASPSPVVTPSPSPKPARSPRVPAKPTDVQQDEVLPQQVQQEVEQNRNQPVSTSVKVTAAFLLRGTSASDFESRYRQAVGQVVSELSGTTVNDWSISTSEQSGGSRRLLQNSNTNLNVDMAIQTTNPKLVVFRLAKRPSAAANGCDSALCSQLVGQGVPVDTDSVLFGPEDIVNGLIVDNAIAGNPEADRLAERRNLGKIIGGSVAGAVVFALLALNYKRFIACYRSKRLVSAQKKQQKLQRQEQNTSDQTAPAATMQIDTKASVDQQQDLGSGVAKHQGLMSHQGTAAAGTPFASAPGAVHATPWVTRFSSQEVADDAVVPATPPEVHYYESNQDEVKHRNDYYLERGHTLDTEEEDLPRVPDQTHMIPKTDAAVPIYHANSDSFKLWADQQAAAAAIAAAAATNNDYAMQRSTPASSSVVEMAAMLPHSPIGSPLNSHRNSSDNMSALAQQTPVMPAPAYNPLDPMAIQQTLNHLQYLMQQQQQMMAMMSSGSITPADYPMAAGGDVAAPHGRISSPGNFIGNPAGGAYPLDVEHRSSTSAPVSGTGTPLASPSAAARMRRVGGFAFKEASVADAGGYPAIDLADVAKLAKADSASTTSSSSRRIRAVSQHGHQNMLATPFANALPGLDV